MVHLDLISWVGLIVPLAVILQGFAWTVLAELAEQVGKIVELHRLESTQSNYLTRWTNLYRFAQTHGKQVV